MWHVVYNGNIEEVRYFLAIGVAIPTFAPKERKVPCNRCKAIRLEIEYLSELGKVDPCMTAIQLNYLKIVKSFDKYGIQSCKSFTALRHAVQSGSVDVVSYLLNKYTYPLNIEYIVKNYEKLAMTLLTVPSLRRNRPQIVKLLLDHGADPAKQMCSPRSVNAIMTAIYCNDLEVLAQYIRSGVNINLKSWDYKYKKISPFKTSVLRNRHYVSEMLLISGCSGGVFSKRKLKNKPKLEKLMKEWNVYDNNVIPLKQRCRCVILNHLSPRADLKIKKLPLPGCLIKFLNIPEFDGFASKP